jgi:hypothetical protein
MRSLVLYWFSMWYASYTTADYVDTMEELLRANREAYLAGPQTFARRDAALAYFDQQWRWLKSSQGCGNKMLGGAGARCIADRQRNGRWPWETYYRDPIVMGRPQDEQAVKGEK